MSAADAIISYIPSQDTDEKDSDSDYFNDNNKYEDGFSIHVHSVICLPLQGINSGNALLQIVNRPSKLNLFRFLNA